MRNNFRALLKFNRNNTVGDGLPVLSVTIAPPGTNVCLYTDKKNLIENVCDEFFHLGKMLLKFEVDAGHPNFSDTFHISHNSVFNEISTTCAPEKPDRIIKFTEKKVCFRDRTECMVWGIEDLPDPKCHGRNGKSIPLHR
ncbi:hypothetical protein GWI33_022001 [Rhynchophorus ferrugineus]|uniref:Uncharacterized protein n=1 Tax=Rhynchophorus ferrugineus TaxID=354439 RepID=A0A834MJB9_RHYFE|nr:hypothetical protein GWI33_022001 [Rhynchophorus ferrugineus]